jgi:hypothetical protein
MAGDQFGTACRKLHDTNPWPKTSALDVMMDYVASDLWDRSFSMTEIRRAFQGALDGLATYSGGRDVKHDA